MSRRIPTALRQAVTVRDDGLCAYCLSRETLLGMPFEVDHIIPLAAGGETTLDTVYAAHAVTGTRRAALRFSIRRRETSCPFFIHYGIAGTRTLRGKIAARGLPG